MSWLLAVDTAVEQGSLALLHDGEVVHQRSMRRGPGHDQDILLEIDAMLVAAGIAIRDIAAFAAASGPGSFTGVRVGLTLVKAFAETLQRPAYGISTLQALAWHGKAARRVPVIDARRHEVYVAMYDSSLQLLEPEVAAPWPDWSTRLQGDEELLALTTGLVHPSATIVTGLASAVGSLAWQQMLCRVDSDALTLDANYVRRSDVEMKWTES